MFNDKRLREIYKDADETNYLLEIGYNKSRNDNKQFGVDLTKPKGDNLWGRMLLNRIEHAPKPLDLRNSLEVCCGNGFLFFSLSQFCKTDCSSHFIDISITQIKDFSDRVHNLRASAPQMLVGDVLELPYSNGTFNLVYGNSFLHHLPDVGAGLREFSRVLRPGGCFIAFHEPTHTAPWLENILAQLKQIVSQCEVSNSLTDIWLFKPLHISHFIKDCGFSSACTVPRNLLSSFFVSPIQTCLGEIGLPRWNKPVIFAKILCDTLDKLFPAQVRQAWSPSLALIAIK